MLRSISIGLLALSLTSSAPVAFSQTWTQIHPGFATRFELDPTDADHLAIETYPPSGGPGIEETWDGGATWTPTATPPLAGDINGFDFGPDGALYVRVRPPFGSLTPQALVFRRSASGWSPIGPIFSPTAQGFEWTSRRFCVSPTDSQKMVLGVERFSFGYKEHTIFETSDGGTTWSPMATGFALVHLSIEFVDGREQVLRHDQINPSTGSEGTWWLDDPWQGGTSSALYTYFNYVVNIDTGRVQPGHMFLLDTEPGTFNTQIQASTDAGSTWEPRGSGEAFRGFARANVDANMLVRTAHVNLPPTTVLFEVSRDGGNTWTAGAAIQQPSLAAPEVFRFSADDSRLYMGGGDGLFVLDFVLELGVSECQSGINSSGQAAVITALGSASVLASDVTLWVTQMAPHQAGILLASTTAGFTANPGGSFGDLCLGGSIGRIANPVLQTGPFGEFSRRLHLGALPTPTGSTAVQAGETWHFQAWFRDFIGVPGSHLSDAVAVTFVP